MLKRPLAALSFTCAFVLAVTGAEAQSLLSDRHNVTGFAARKMIEAIEVACERPGPIVSTQ